MDLANSSTSRLGSTKAETPALAERAQRARTAATVRLRAQALALAHREAARIHHISNLDPIRTSGAIAAKASTLASRLRPLLLLRRQPFRIVRAVKSESRHFQARLPPNQ